MKRWARLRAALIGSLPTLVVLLVVVAVGTRLMYLSVQHHAAVAHEAAATVGASFAAKLEPPLLALTNFATRQASSTPATERDSPELRIGLPRSTRAFWMTADDKVMRAPSEEGDLASGIASEWQSAESVRALPGSAILGPMRLGSRWIVAARAPFTSPADGRAVDRAGWSVAYADLEDLIADSHLARLVDMGYDFQLSQIMSRGAQPRIFVGSSFEPLPDAVGTRVRLPTATIPGSYLELAIRPRTGWYPASLLAADVGLLAFLAWLLAFGTHDLSHALLRSRDALGTARRRLRHMNQQLASEMKQRMKLQETFSHALFHDAFTGLPNRRYFMDSLDRALRDVRAKQLSRIAVIIVDITRFKLVNDLLGHTAGDELMVQAARRFEKSAAGFEGVLARWGGDQFALLIQKVESTSEALNIGALLREDLRFPFQLRRHQLVVAASVGVTCTDSGQRRAEDVVREADVALSVAKQSEGSRIVLYAPNMTGQAATLVSLEADLHIALEKHQLHLLLQPVVDLRTYQMVGAEALLRWIHPVESVLAPDRFLRIAEEAGLMVPITRWVILRALKIAANWRQRLPAGQPFYISINLSPTALRDPELAAYVGTLLRETGIHPGFIKFEVSEAALIANVGAARETLEQLHALGVGLMLDDFGTGFTSLSNLQLFPFDFVKIERPFGNLDNADQANTGMMAAMVQMAATLKLTAIAEIVESEAAATALQQMGCEYGQGYYFSGPIEAEEALLRLRSQVPFEGHKSIDMLEASEPKADSLATERDAPLTDLSTGSFNVPDDPTPALTFPPLEELAAPMAVPPPKDLAETMAVRPLKDLGDTLVVPPLKDINDTLVVALLKDGDDTLIVAPLKDSADTLVVAPLKDSADTLVVAPLKDSADTMVVAPLKDSADTLIVAPLNDPADTLIVAPLKDPADTTAVPTLRYPADSIVVPPRRNIDDTMAMPPLKDPSDSMGVPPPHNIDDTMAMPPLKDPADTMVVPPLNNIDDTMAMPPLNDPLSIDSSPTVMLPPLSSKSPLTVEVPARRNPPPNPRATPREKQSGATVASTAEAGQRRDKDKKS